MILDRILEVSRVKKQVAHGDEPEDVLGINGDALLEIIGRILQLALLEVQDTQLTEGLVVIRVLLDTKLVVLFGHLWVVGQEVQSLAVSEVSGDAFGVEFASVLEVLHGLLVVAKFSQQCCVVQASPEMLLIHLEAALEVLDRPLIVFLLLADDAEVEESVDHGAVGDVDGTLEEGASVIKPLLLLVDATQPDQRLWVLAVLLD